MAVALLLLDRHSKRVMASASFPLVPLCLMIFLSDLVSGNAHGAVKLSGEIASDYYSPEGKLMNHGLSRFWVARDGSRWQLTTEQAGSEAISIASDGNAAFTIITATNTSTPRVAAARGLTNVNVNGRMQVGIVDPWNFPAHTPAESLPWWFLVLTKDSEVRFSDLPTPWTLPRSDPQAYFCSNSISWSDAQPWLVATVAFFYSCDRVWTALDTVVINKQTEPFVSIEEARMLGNVLRRCTNVVKAGEASVLDWTNSLYGRFPLKFECVVYDSLAGQLYDRKLKKFRPEYAGRVPTVRIKYHGTVTSVEEVPSVACPPNLQGPTWVADNRFRDASSKVQRLEYGPVDNWITNMSRVKTRSSPHFRIDTIRMATAHAPPWARWVMWVLLFVALGFPLLLMRLRKGTEKSKALN